jgi:hypothetical protein
MILDAVILIAIGLVLIFGLVVLVGAPYLPTRAAQSIEALELLDLPKGSKILELGSGDGCVMKIAASRYGLVVTGVEINPILVLVSKIRCRKLPCDTVLGNLWNQSTDGYDAIFVFLHPRFMSRLHKKILAEISKETKLVSYAFPIKGLTAAKTTRAMYLYHIKPTAKI